MLPQQTLQMKSSISKMSKRPVWLALYVCLMPLVVPSTAEEFVVRNTVYGKIRGYVQTVLGSKKVERYLGVPYTAPPVGELRFEYPEEPTPWEGIRNTTVLSPACPQTNWGYVRFHIPDFYLADEDCLYLNIYVPQTGRSKRKMAVLVHIHGGGSEVGMGAMFDGDVLAVLGEIIVVNFNYRLAWFGFMSGERPEFPGNYGLMDQTAALKWVNRNIHYFGGDPAKVTIEGHSAGGGDVGFHIISPISKGLFRYAIMQSGTPSAYWALLRSPGSAFNRTVLFAEKLGCDIAEDHDMQKIKQCLKTKHWTEISKQDYGTIPGWVTFSPVIDDVFLSGDIQTSLTNSPLNGESFMAGMTHDEGAGRASYLNLSVQGGIMMTSSSISSAATFDVDLDLVVYEYKPWEDPVNQTANYVAVTHFMSDYGFIAPTVDVVNRLSERTDAVYLYSFEYTSPRKGWTLGHGRDQFYLFGSPLVGHPLYHYSGEDKQVSKIFINMWSNYVKTGKPSINTDQWTREFPEYDVKNQTYMIITGYHGKGIMTTAQRLRPRQMAFWNILHPRMRNTHLNTIPSNYKYGPLTWVLAGLSGVLFLCLIASIICALLYRRHNSLTNSGF